VPGAIARISLADRSVLRLEPQGTPTTALASDGTTLFFCFGYNEVFAMPVGGGAQTQVVRLAEGVSKTARPPLVPDAHFVYLLIGNAAAGAAIARAPRL
jgi:hypothetical protein